MNDGPEGRYGVLGLLGRGGSGEVERVLDRRLGRVVARKRLRLRVEEAGALGLRFAEEARVQAMLQHPGVPPVHDLGLDEQERPAFTLAEVRGQTLLDAIGALHAACSDGAWARGAGGISLRRLVEVLARVAETVAFAHAAGVLHRDLKPANIMLGPYGEVVVLDWGLARLPASRALPEGAEALGRRADRTAQGVIQGTPATMAPEQARGEGDRVGPQTDVYGLGALLYQVLSDRPPHADPDAYAALAAARAAQPPPLGRAGGPAVPPELERLCWRCLAADPAARPPGAAAVAEGLRAWLDGAARREAALAQVALAERRLAERQRDRAAAQAATLAAEAALAGVQAWEPEDRKAAGWALQDQAAALARSAAQAALEAESILEMALTSSPDSVEPRAALAALHRAALDEAEASGEARAAEEAEERLRRHAEALPVGHPARAGHLAFLAGEGWLTLLTEPPGAEVWVDRYEEQQRRLVPAPRGRLGHTPLVRCPLPMGSYRLTLRRAGFHDVVYPVLIQRQTHWSGAPGADAPPLPVPLPPLGALGPEDRYVPAGPFWTGGDPLVPEAGPRRWLWVDGFVIRRDPVTVGELLDALNALVEAGDEATAAVLEPRSLGDEAAPRGRPVFSRDEAGRYRIPPDAQDQALRLPATLVDLFGAEGYSRWLAQRSRVPWRLPTAEEWEKAARGVDGRRFPMGDSLIAAWTHCKDSAARVSGPLPVDALSQDVSPYGLRSCCGNVMNWCLPQEGDGGPRASVRGASWMRDSAAAAVGRSYQEHPQARFPVVGFRIARSIDAFSWCDFSRNSS